MCPTSADYDKANDSLGVLFAFLYPFFLLDYLSRFVIVYIENLGTEIQKASEDFTGSVEVGLEPLGAVSVGAYLFVGGIAAFGGIFLASAAAAGAAGGSAFIMSAISIALIYFYGEEGLDSMPEDSPLAPYAEEIVALTEDGLALGALWLQCFFEIDIPAAGLLTETIMSESFGFLVEYGIIEEPKFG